MEWEIPKKQNHLPKVEHEQTLIDNPELWAKSMRDTIFDIRHDFKRPKEDEKINWIATNIKTIVGILNRIKHECQKAYDAIGYKDILEIIKELDEFLKNPQNFPLANTNKNKMYIPAFEYGLLGPNNERKKGVKIHINGPYSQSMADFIENIRSNPDYWCEFHNLGFTTLKNNENYYAFYDWMPRKESIPAREMRERIEDLQRRTNGEI